MAANIKIALIIVALMVMAYAQEQVNEDMDLAETKHHKGYYGGYLGGYPAHGYYYPRYYRPKGYYGRPKGFGYTSEEEYY